MTQATDTRQSLPLRYDWRFTRSDVDGANPSLDDSGWETVRVPHDWAIAGPFDEANDLQFTMIMEDGEKKPRNHSGRTGGLPHVGLGWYRRRFCLADDLQGKRVLVEFDGVMSHSTVYVNGQTVGSWPFGYASFAFDITDYVRFGEENVLAVKVDNKPCASRWYPGAGIYRHVRLTIVSPVHVAHWGTYVTITEIDNDAATVSMRTGLANQSETAGEVELTTEILDPGGKQVAVASSKTNVSESEVVEQALNVTGVQRWDVDAPKLYQAVSKVSVGGEIVDEYTTRFGIRDVRFDANEGFFLNGRSLKLNGVCQHHDLGPLGSAVNRRGLERQLGILRDMGCNAIRTSHNPPAPELLDLCDEMGFLVIDEAFDEWKVAKVDNGYHILFDEWAEKDLVAMIRRDRNHPCVIMWSIGNEIGEQGREDGAAVARFLTDICHREDPTRPVTAGFNNPDGAIKNGLADVVDIPGWNYKPFKYREYHEQHPDWIMYGSENESCVSTRGEYCFPVEEEREVLRETLQITSYDLAAPNWGYSPDREFEAQDECPFIMGEFVWTGFDYLGEPTPYKEQWPSRSSYFGIIDLCGIPKDRFYLYQSKWADKEVLHLLPHWNWEGREGEVTPVHCYTSYDSAELFLNGKSMGVRQKRPDGLFDRYRLIWDDVKYEAGELKVVALGEDGKPVAEKVVKTAGAPARIELSPDRAEVRADGDDLCYVTVRVTDQDGNLCPLADSLVSFSIDGPAEIVAVGNGDPTSLESFQASYRRAFHGLCILIVRSVEGDEGEARVKAEPEGLTPAETMIRCRT